VVWILALRDAAVGLQLSPYVTKHSNDAKQLQLSSFSVITTGWVNPPPPKKKFFGHNLSRFLQGGYLPIAQLTGTEHCVGSNDTLYCRTLPTDNMAYCLLQTGPTTRWKLSLVINQFRYPSDTSFVNCYHEDNIADI